MGSQSLLELAENTIPSGARREVPASTSAVVSGTLPAGMRCALWVSVPNTTAFVLRESVASVSAQSGVPLWPCSTRRVVLGALWFTHAAATRYAFTYCAVL